MSFSIAYTYKITDLYSQPLARIKKKTTFFRKTLKDLEKTTNSLTRNIGNTAKSIGNVSTKLRTSANVTTRATNTLKKYTKRVGEATRANREFNRTALSTTAPHLPRKPGAGKPGTRKGASLDMPGTLGTVGAVITTAFPLVTAAKFEFKLADVKKTTSATAAQMEMLTKKIFESASEMGKMPGAIADIVTEGGKLGILPEKLGDFVKTITRGSVAFDEMESVVAESMASIATKMKIPIDEIASMMDAINFAADNSAAKGRQVIQILQRTSGTMADIKMPPELAVGMAAFADQLEVSPELAASGFSMMIRRMQKLPGRMQKFAIDPVRTIKEELLTLSKIDPLRRPRKVTKMFGEEAGRFVTKAINNIELLNKTMGLVSDKTKFSGSMMKELAIKMKTAVFQANQLKAEFIVLSIRLGTMLLPELKKGIKFLREMVDIVRTFIKENPKLSKILLLTATVGAALAALVIPVGLFVGALAFAFTGLKLLVAPLLLISRALLGFTPLGWIVLGLTAAGFAIEYIVAKMGGWAKVWEKFKGVVSSVATTVKEFIGLGPEVTFPDIKQSNIPLKATMLESNVMEHNVASEFHKKTSGEINGKITVEAEPGTRVTRMKTHTTVSGNLGLNLAY